MDGKKFLNILVGVILLVFCLLFFTPTTAMGSDCELIFEKGQTIIAPSNADEITEFMYKDGAYSYYSIYLKIDTEKIILENRFEYHNNDINSLKRLAKTKTLDVNSDQIPDYIVILPIARSLDFCYVVDGKTHKIIFSSEWDKPDRDFTMRHFSFGSGWIVEKVKIGDPDANDPGKKYIYGWDQNQGKFILKSTKDLWDPVKERNQNP